MRNRLLAGVALLGGRLLGATLRMHRQLRGAVPVTEPWMLELLASCRAVLGIRRKVMVVTTSIVDSPALTGLFRPRLLLPESLPAGVSPLQLRFIFLHELAHLKRNDLLLNWIMLVLQTLHWPNPLIRFASYRMRADRELACDDLVLSRLEPAETRDYGRTIIALLERLSHPASIPGAVGILEHKQQIERRIVMIARFPGTSRLTWPAAVLLAGLGFTALTEPAPGSTASQNSTAISTLATSGRATSQPGHSGAIGGASGSVTSVVASTSAAEPASLSPAQQKLQKKLETPISVALGGATYRMALDTVMGASGIKLDIAFDAKVIIDAEGKVDLKAAKVSSALALKSLLTARGLAYRLADDGVHVEKAAPGDSNAEALRILSDYKGGHRRMVIINDGEEDTHAKPFVIRAGEGLRYDKDTEAKIEAGEVDMKSIPEDGELRLVVERPAGQKEKDGKQEKKVIIMKQKGQP